MKEKDRHISILDYFKILQIEYLLCELRSKIYPSQEDKTKYKTISKLKKEKIDDISKKNTLTSIFQDNDIRKEMVGIMFDNHYVPKEFTKRDKYFYFFIGTDFSHKGVGYKLISYNLENQTAIIENNNISKHVDLLDIRRIF